MRIIFTSLFVLSFFCSSVVQIANAQDKLASEKELYTDKEFTKAFVNPKDDPALPNILVIGDSISIGYTVPLRKLLKDRADVYRIPTNGRYASYGLKNLDKWLGTRKWDVIHFNWGLWDICYRNPESTNQGHRDKIKGTLTATPAEYKQSMTAIIDRLKFTGATLIWSTTTPVPKFEVGRKEGDEVVYNSIVNEIAIKSGVVINDLHSYSLLHIPDDQRKMGDVHFTKTGYKNLALKVFNSISLQLPKI